MSKLIYRLLLVSTTFNIINIGSSYCESNRCKMYNTLCKMSPCKPPRRCGFKPKWRLLRASERKYVVNLHNNLRDNVATGNRSGYPPAGDMELISYSLELEYFAQCWANQCTTESDNCRSTEKFEYIGSNRFQTSSTSKGSQGNKELLKEAVRFWMSNSPPVNREFLESYERTLENTNFTQMIYSKLKYIGCGIIYFETQAVAVCDYAPELRQGAMVYKEGKPCGGCKDKCGSEYNALCGSDSPDDDFDPPFLMSADSINLNLILFDILFVIHQILMQYFT